MGATQNEDIKRRTNKVSSTGNSKDKGRTGKKLSLNLGTNIFPENRDGGLMICGINWGGEPDPNIDYYADMVEDSFFSDAEVNNKPKQPNRFNNRIVDWFGLLGHPLETSKVKAGTFEHSIIQTNWIRGKSKNVDNREFPRLCLEELYNFEYHVIRFKPKILMFFSVKLFDALRSVLRSKECSSEFRDCLGETSHNDYIRKKHDVIINGKKLRRFTVGIQTFSKTVVIALPHPTPQREHPDDNYIASFKKDISPILAKYKLDKKIDDKNKSR